MSNDDYVEGLLTKVSEKEGGFRLGPTFNRMKRGSVGGGGGLHSADFSRGYEMNEYGHITIKRLY